MAAPIAAALVRIGQAVLGRAAAAKAGTAAAGTVIPEGASVAQKATLLKKAGKLLDIADTLSAFRGTKGRDEIGIPERVQASEQRIAEEEQQRAREERVEEEKKAVKSRIWKTATAGGALAVASGWGLKKFGDALERLSATMLERQRDLARFSPVIQGAFARLERQELGLRIGRAGATGESTRRLADALMNTRRELEPLRRAGVTLANIAGTGLAQAASFLALLTRLNPIMQGILKFCEWFEGKEDMKGIMLTEFVRDVAQNNWDGKRDRDAERRAAAHDLAMKAARKILREW